MSKNKDSDSDVDIYEDLPNFSSDNAISQLENAKKNLENELKVLKLKLKDTQIENNKLKTENESLSINISSLYKTAACEIKRKDQIIQEIRKEKDSIIFRRHRKEGQNYSRRPDPRAEVVHVINDSQPAVENEVYIIDERLQQHDNTSNQHTVDKQYNQVFPEEDEEDNCTIQTFKEVPSTIFSRRKAQQLKLMNKKSESVKDSNIAMQYTEADVIATYPEKDEEHNYARRRPKEVPSTSFSHRQAEQLKLSNTKYDSSKYINVVDIRSLEPEVIIKEVNKHQRIIFDRKTRKLKSCNEQHGILEVVPEAKDYVVGVKDKSSVKTVGSRSIDLNNRKTVLSTNRMTVQTSVAVSSKENEEHGILEVVSEAKDHVVGVKRNSSVKTVGSKSTDLNNRKTVLSTNTTTVQTSVAVSSKENELPKATLKTTQCSRNEDVNSSRTKSCHKNKEHFSVDNIRSEKPTHISSKDKDRGSGSNAYSHGKSSASSSPKYSSPAKDSISSKSPKSRSTRETSVSKALKSLRSKSEHKSSKNPKVRDKQKEVANEKCKKVECQEYKKREQTREKLPVPSSEKRQLRSVHLPDTHIKPKMIPDTTSVSQGTYTKTKSCDKTQNPLHKEILLKANEKEQYRTCTEKVAVDSDASFEESGMVMQKCRDMSHKEVPTDVGTLCEKDIAEIRDGDVLQQKGSRDVMSDRQTLDNQVPTDKSKLHEEASEEMAVDAQIFPKNGISKMSQGSGSSQDKIFAETSINVDLLPKKVTDEKPAPNSAVIEKIPTGNDELHMEIMSERSADGDMSSKEGISEQPTNVDTLLKESVCEMVSCKDSITSSVDSGVSLETMRPHIESEVSIADTPLKSKNNTCIDRPVEINSNDKVKDVQDSRKSNLDDNDITLQSHTKQLTNNSDLSTNTHVEENYVPNLRHEKKNPLESSHFEHLDSKAGKDSKRKYSTSISKNSAVTEPVDSPIDATENSQRVSNTVHTNGEETDHVTSQISYKQSVSEERTKSSLLNDHPLLQKPSNESPSLEKELTKPVNHTLPNANASLSPTATFTKGNVSFAVVNERGCFRRRKLKRISTGNLNSTIESNTIQKALNEQQKCGSTKRPYEHMHKESSESPPVKKQALADPQKDYLHSSAIEAKSMDDSSQALSLKSQSNVDEKNTSVTETNNTPSDKNNTSDLEEGEIEDDVSDEGTEEDNKEIHRERLVKSIIRSESNIRKDHSRKYLDLGRKARENRRKRHGSHPREFTRGNRNKHQLPSKLFSHCKRRSPSELLIKDRNIKRGKQEKETNSRSRSTSSETSRNTNEFNKNERLKDVPKERYRSKENSGSKINVIREETKDIKDKIEASNTKHMHINKEKNLSTCVQRQNYGNSDDSSRSDAQSALKENTIPHSEPPSRGNNQGSFKIPATSNQTVTPISKYVIKRRKVCNLQDNVSLPVINISPPKPIIRNNSGTVQSVKSLPLKTIDTPKTGMLTSEVALKKTNSSTCSKETLSKASAGEPATLQPNLNWNRISPSNKSLASSYKTVDVHSDSISSSSSEYENNSDETWNPKGRRKKRTRKNPKTEVTKTKAAETVL